MVPDWTVPICLEMKIHLQGFYGVESSIPFLCGGQNLSRPRSSAGNLKLFVKMLIQGDSDQILQTNIAGFDNILSLQLYDNQDYEEIQSCSRTCNEYTVVS